MERAKEGIGAVVVVILAAILSTWAPDEPGAGASGEGDPVTVISGGVGKEEADVMRAMAPGYPLQLTFIRKVDDREEFVADVRLTIFDAAGRVVVNRSSGPLVLVRAPD